MTDIHSGLWCRYIDRLIDPKIIAKSVVIAAVSHGRPAKDAEKRLCQRVKREWFW